MLKTIRVTHALLGVALAIGGLGCEEPTEKKEATATASAPAKVSATPPPTVSTPPPKPAVKKPSHSCPDGTEGEGTFNKPCVAKGKTRIMDVKWNGKIGDKGPTFRIISKSDLEIVYGRIVVYFYDKAGKQIEVGQKKKGYLTCSGNIFAGAVKPKEKIFMNFSCVKKKDVPEGAKFIEGEIQTAGFVAKDSKNADTYWRNKDLTPDQRPKGGIKK